MDINAELTRLDPNRQYLHRFFDNAYVSEYSTKYKIVMESYQIVKETPAGYWILINNFYWPRDIIPRKYQKFVLKYEFRESCKHPSKRFAYREPEAAWLSFKIRKQRQLGHLERGLTRCKNILNMIKKQETERTISNFFEEKLHEIY